jgi:hypothetical protein
MESLTTPHSCCLGEKPGNRNFTIPVAKQVLQHKGDRKTETKPGDIQKRETVTEDQTGWKTFWMHRIGGA